MSIRTDDNTVVMYVNGRRYRVTVDITDYDLNGAPHKANVTIMPTSDPVTVESGLRKCTRSNTTYKFGGYPEFLQNIHEPTAPDGLPYTYICTINTPWGDSGNANIFALIRGESVEDVYVEASCC